MHDNGNSEKTISPTWHLRTLSEEQFRTSVIEPLKRRRAVLTQVVNTGFVDRATRRVLNPWTLHATPDQLDPSVKHDYTSTKRGLDLGVREGVFEINSHGWTHVLPDLDSPPGPFWDAELVPARRSEGFPFGVARQEPLAPPGDAWWQPMTDSEADDWINGR